MIVLDNSALIEALTGNEPAPSLVDAVATGDVHVPHLIDYEFRNALRGLVLGRKVSARRAVGARLVQQDLPMCRYPDSYTADRAWDLRDNFNGYDATYVALAEALGCALLTNDEKIARAARTIEVRLPPSR